MHNVLRVTAGLDRLPGGAARSVERFLSDYLGTSASPTPFGGRQTAIAELHAWLADPVHLRALLVAEAGRGKSALLAHWIADVVRSESIAVAFVPISIRYDTAAQRAAISLLGARLRHLHDVVDEPPRDLRVWKAEIDRYLRTDRSNAAPLLVVIDGIDEAIDWHVSRDLAIPDQLGRNVKVLVSARPLAHCDAAGWLQRLGWSQTTRVLELPPLTPAGVRQVVDMFMLSAGVSADVIAERLFHLSAGDPLLVRLYADVLRDTGALPEAVPGAMPPPGLIAFFDQWWADQRRQWREAVPLAEPAVRVILELLACALGPLRLADLEALLTAEEFDSEALQDALRPLARFVVGEGVQHGYVFSHSRLSEYITAQLAPEARRRWEQRLCDYGYHTLHALRREQCAPENASAYAVCHYGAHLELAGATCAALDELVRPAWQQAWQVLDGTPDGFLYDVARAWRQAEREGTQAETAEARGQAIALQCRYALITTTITSGIQSIPAALIVALVERGIWSSAWGLAYAQRLTDSSQVAALLAGLAPRLEDTQLAAALETAQRLAHEAWEPEGLIGLAPVLPEPLLRLAIATAHEFPDDDEMFGSLRSRTLAVLLPHLAAQGARDEALAVAHTLGDAMERVRALVAIAQHLSSAERAEALADALTVARTIDYPEARVEALVAVLPHFANAMHAKVLGEALAAAAQVEESIAISFRAQAQAAVLTHAPEVLRAEVLTDVLGMLRVASDAEVRADALATLAPLLPEALLPQALKLAGNLPQDEARGVRTRSTALRGLVPRLATVGRIHEALALARSFPDTLPRLELLVALSDPLELPERRTILDEARALLPDIAEPHDRDHALATLAPSMAACGDGAAALALVQAIRNTCRHDETLAALIPHLSATQLRAVLTAAQAPRDHVWLAQALARLAPHAHEVQRGALLDALLEVAPDVEQDDSLIELLRPCVAAFTESQVHMAIQVVQGTMDRWRRPQALASLLPRLAALGHRGEAVMLALALVDGDAKVRALARLIPHLAPDERSGALEAALEVARKIDYPRDRAWAFAALLRALPAVPTADVASVIAETHATTRDIVATDDRIEALVGIAELLAEPGRSALLREALETAQAEELPILRDAALERFVWYAADLLAPLLPATLAAVRALAPAGIRALALARLAKHAPEADRPALIDEALGMARATDGDSGRQAQTLVESATYLSGPALTTALAIARAIADPSAQSVALARLARCLEGDAQAIVLAEALEAVHGVEGQWHDTALMACLEAAPALPEPLLRDAVRAVQDLSFDGWRERALAALAPALARLPIADLYPIWCELFRALSSRSRRDLLVDLSILPPVLAALGGESIVGAVAQAIIEVQHWGS